MNFWKCMMVMSLMAGLAGWSVQAQAENPVASLAAAAGVTVAAQAAEAVPVLCYHRFGQYPGADPYFVTPEEFRHQLELIKQAGFTPITVSALRAGWAGQGSLPAKPLLITIDDGYADFMKSGLPIFKEFGYTATLFVYTHFIDSQRGLSHEQLAVLEKEGFEIGSHSVTHPKLTKPTRLEAAHGVEAFLKSELEGSRNQLKAWLGHEVAALAYPYGLWDTKVAQAARDAGYDMMFTVDQGTNSPQTPREQLKRIMIVRHTSDRMFKFLLEDRPLRVAKRSLEPGARVAGPLEGLTLTVDPEQRETLNLKSWSVLKGGVKCVWTYEAGTGQLKVVFPKPWTHGTDAVMVMARGKQGRQHYKETWLATVTVSENQAQTAASEGGEDKKKPSF